MFRVSLMELESWRVFKGMGLEIIDSEVVLDPGWNLFNFLNLFCTIMILFNAVLFGQKV